MSRSRTRRLVSASSWHGSPPNGGLQPTAAGAIVTPPADDSDQITASIRRFPSDHEALGTWAVPRHVAVSRPTLTPGLSTGQTRCSTCRSSFRSRAACRKGGRSVHDVSATGCPNQRQPHALPEHFRQHYGLSRLGGLPANRRVMVYSRQGYRLSHTPGWFACWHDPRRNAGVSPGIRPPYRLPRLCTPALVSIPAEVKFAIRQARSIQGCFLPHVLTTRICTAVTPANTPAFL